MRQIRDGDFFTSLLRLMTLIILIGGIAIWVLPNLSFKAFALVWTIVFGVIGLYKIMVWGLDKRSPLK